MRKPGSFGRSDDDLLATARREPATVARWVRTGIENGDPRAAEAVIALAAAGVAPPDAAGQLRVATARARGLFLVRAAEALHVLTGDRSAARMIAPVLDAPDEAERRAAAAALARIGARPVT